MALPSLGMAAMIDEMRTGIPGTRLSARSGRSARTARTAKEDEVHTGRAGGGGVSMGEHQTGWEWVKKKKKKKKSVGRI